MSKLVTLPYSTDQLRAVVELIRRKPDVIEAFQVDRKRLPSELRLSDEECTQLHDAGLMDEQNYQFRPAFRLRREEAGVLVTRDFPRRELDVREPIVNKPVRRVFPWPDEAQQIHRYVVDRYKTERNLPKRILNMCCGSGAIALSLTRHWAGQNGRFDRILGVDMEELSVRRSEYNRLLNQYDGHPFARSMEFHEGDLCACEDLRPGEMFDLIVAAPPYSLHPPQHTASGHQGGGERGISVVQPLIEQCRERLAPGGRLICQCYSLGDSESPTLLHEVVATALQLAPDEACRAVVPRPDWKVWRFRDVKCFDTPMPVEYMAVRCSDPTYPFYAAFEKDPEGQMREYVAWIERIKKGDAMHRGYSHLHYVMIDYRNPD